MRKNGIKYRITLKGSNIVIIDDLMCLKSAGTQVRHDEGERIILQLRWAPGKNKIGAFKIDTIQTIKEIFVSGLDYYAMGYSNPILHNTRMPEIMHP